MAGKIDLLRNLYAAFNAREIETALAAMHADVVWPNGMEGGWVNGRAGVRAYWTRQWEMIDPHVELVRIAVDQTGGIVVDVRQVVRNRAGELLADQMVQHVYRIEDELITTMEIRKS